MGPSLLIFLICLPVLEIIVFINIGQFIGAFNTISITVLTSLAGTYLLKRQGLSVLTQAHENMVTNKFSMEIIYDGIRVVIAGILLIIPGLVTDMLGILLFLPHTRLIIKGIGIFYVKKHAHMSSYINAPSKASDDGIIDGDFQDITNKQKPPYESVKKINTDN